MNMKVKGEHDPKTVASWLSKNGAVIGRQHYTVSQKNKDKIENDLIVIAAQKALSKANVTASAITGKKNVKCHAENIYVNPMTQHTQQNRYMASDSKKHDSVPLSGGESDISVTVKITAIY